MASKTDNIGLDLYDTGDAANLRDQYNSSMHTLDETVTVINTNATDALTKANTAIDNLEALGVTDTTTGETLKNTIAGHTDSINAINGQISNIESVTIPGINENISEVKNTADNALSLATTNESDIADIDANLNALHANTVEDATALYNQIQNIAKTAALRAPNFSMEGIDRWTLETGSQIGEARRSVQACQYYNDNTVVVYETCENNQSMARVAIHNSSGIVASQTGYYGHTGSMGIYNGYLYIFDDENGYVYRATISESYIGTFSQVYSWTANNYHASIIDGVIYEFNYRPIANNLITRNIETGAIESQTTVVIPGYSTTRIANGGAAFKYNGDVYLYNLYSSPGYLTIYDLEGNQLSSVELPKNISCVDQGEIEYFSFDESGKFFMSTQDSAMSAIVSKAGAVFRGDIVNGAQTWNNPIYDQSTVYFQITDDATYKFPHTATGSTAYSDTNPLMVYFTQDIANLLNTYNIYARVVVGASRTDTGISLNGGQGIIDYSGNTIVTRLFGSTFKLSNITGMTALTSTPSFIGTQYAINAQDNSIVILSATVVEASLGSHFMYFDNAVIITRATNENISNVCSASGTLINYNFSTLST